MSNDFDAIVVGAGPGGSTCARHLVRAGAKVLLLDREDFPRPKLCAGWITPDILREVQMDPADYPHRFNSFDRLVIHLKGITFGLKTVQHSIRRYEFDAHLVELSGAPLERHNVKAIEQAGGVFVIDGKYRARHLVGAGGTRCPVYRSLFRDLPTRESRLQVATIEHEFPFEWKDPRCHLWFFDNGLPGYSWYVPKADGYLNCGTGAMAEAMKARGQDIKSQWQHFASALEAAGLLPEADFKPKGYSYYIRGFAPRVQNGNAYLVGDAAGLATCDLGEGIGPAVKSGRLAAESILSGKPYSVKDVEAYSPIKPGLAKLLNGVRRWRESRSEASR